VKYDSAGNRIWAITFDKGNAERGERIVVTDNGNILVTGSVGNFLDNYLDSSLTVKFKMTKPNLIISELTIPVSANPGENISLSDKTKNQGMGNAGASTTKFYLSIDTMADGNDMLLGSRPVPALSAGASNTQELNVTIPSGTALGNYYIIAVADADNIIKEYNDSNNAAYKAITIIAAE
jgi:subtilase family serine protease